MSLGFSIIPSSSPTKNPKLGPSLVDKLNPNSANLTKKIIIRIPKKKQLGSTRQRYSRYPSKIASFKYQPTRKGGISILPSFAKFKKSPKFDIRKLVDSVKHVIEANQKESLYVNNISYENASQWNVEMTDNVVTLKNGSFVNRGKEFRNKQRSKSGDRETEKKLAFLSKEQNEINKPTTKLIETRETNEINETNGAIHPISLQYLQDESQIKEIPKMKNNPYTENKALDTSEQEELKSYQLKLKMPRRRFILFNPRTYYVGKFPIKSQM